MRPATNTLRIALVASAGLAFGCGPIVSGVQIIHANVAVNAAENAGADQHALYEITAAREYLYKAREEHGYSEFSASRDYADKALQLATQARRKAGAAAKVEPQAAPPKP